MATAGTTNDKDWMIYREIRAIADHTGSPVVKGIADGVHQRLMAPEVMRDAYSPNERREVAHDSAAPVTSARVTQDKYRAYANVLPQAHDAKPAPASTPFRLAERPGTRASMRPRPTIEDKYRAYRK